jgi:hypothetical protein
MMHEGNNIPVPVPVPVTQEQEQQNAPSQSDTDTAEEVKSEKPTALLDLFADMKDKAANLKEKVLSPKSDEKGSGVDGDKPATESETRDLMEKPKQMITDMKERASKALASRRSEDNASDEEDKPDPLKKSKQFFNDMKDKASNLKLKALTPRDVDARDEDGESLPSPLDKMKSEMKSFAAGMKRKASKPQNSSAEPAPAPAFTISDDSDDDVSLMTNISKPSSDFSIKLSELVESAVSVTSGSFRSLPSLSSNSASSRMTSFSDKLSSFRPSNIIPNRENGEKKETGSPVMEEVEFFSTNSDNGPTPTIDNELRPLFKEKRRNSQEHWENNSPPSKDVRPTMVSRQTSGATIVQIPPPSMNGDDDSII